MPGVLRRGGPGRAQWVSAMLTAFAALGLAAGGAIASPATAASPYPAYVASTGLGKISPISTALNTPGLPSLSTSSPGAMAITPDGTTLYVCNHDAGTVTPITLATGASGRPITVGANPSGIAITPDGSKAYVTNAGVGTVTAINLLTGSTSTIRVGTNPSGVAITPDGSRAYVVNQYDATVTPIAISTNSAGAAIPVGTGGNASKPSAIAITPDGSTAYVVNSSGNSIVPIATASNRAGTPITGVSAPSAIAITPDGRTAYITEDGAAGHLVPLNLATRALGSAIAVGMNPVGVSITPDQKTAYVADSGGGFFFFFGAGSVTPVSLGTGTAGSPVDTFGGLSSIVIGPDQAPVASMTVTAAPAGAPSSFDASSSTVKYGSITAYAWKFGDGQTATTSTPTTSHTYASPGTYTASVTETDSAGTSTTQVFTGQTVTRNGGASARIAKQVQIGQRGASAPRVALQVASHLAITRRGRIVFAIYCPARAIRGCRGTITLRLAPALHPRFVAVAARCGRGCRILTSRPYAARPGHRVSAAMDVSADVGRALRSRKALRVKLTVTNVVGGSTSSSSRMVMLSRRGHRAG